MIRIIADTTSCIPVEEAKRLGIGYIPQIIVFGEETFRDDYEMDPPTFVKRLRASASLPKTAAPPPALYTPLYQEIQDKGDTAIVLCPSSDLSGTYRSANVAAKEFPNADIRIIDTRIIAGGFGELVKQANEWASQDFSADEVVDRIQKRMQQYRIYFVVDTLEYLFKGGRIGAAKALFGSILQVKPILTLQNGVIQPCESQRTHKRAIARLTEIVALECPKSSSAHFSLMHGDAIDESYQIADQFSSLLNVPKSSIPIYDMPPAIMVHAGPGVIAASFFVDEA
jgi:DegV family protein with EDD domain